MPSHDDQRILSGLGLLGAALPASRFFCLGLGFLLMRTLGPSFRFWLDCLGFAFGSSPSRLSSRGALRRILGVVLAIFLCLTSATLVLVLGVTQLLDLLLDLPSENAQILLKDRNNSSKAYIRKIS